METALSSNSFVCLQANGKKSAGISKMVDDKAGSILLTKNKISLNSFERVLQIDKNCGQGGTSTFTDQNCHSKSNHFASRIGQSVQYLICLSVHLWILDYRYHNVLS